MSRIIVYVLLGMMLFYCAGTDVRKKKVSEVVLGAFAGIGIVMYFIVQLISIKSLIGGIGIGLVVIGVSKLTKGGIGLGDGELLCVTGLYVGFYKNLEIFLLALFLAAVWGTVLLVMKKADRKTEMPFVPFITISYMLVILPKVTEIL